MWNPPIVTPCIHHDGAFSGEPKIAVRSALTGPNRIEWCCCISPPGSRSVFLFPWFGPAGRGPPEPFDENPEDDRGEPSEEPRDLVLEDEDRAERRETHEGIAEQGA